MPKRERWLRPANAARLVAHHRGVSIGASLPILRDAMSSDEVRMRSVADPRNPEYLAAELWIDAQFDLDRNVIVGADPWALERGLSGQCQYDAIEISGDDLEFWLNKNSAPLAKPDRNANGGAPSASDELKSSARQIRKRRRDEKRPEMIRAIADLEGSTEWQKAHDGQRCRMVERHLKKPELWCSVRTLNRAIADRARQRPSE